MIQTQEKYIGIPCPICGVLFGLSHGCPHVKEGDSTIYSINWENMTVDSTYCWLNCNGLYMMESNWLEPKPVRCFTIHWLGTLSELFYFLQFDFANFIK